VSAAPGAGFTVFGLILAGGRATRMGGRDKALLPLAGRPLLGRVADRLAPQVDGLLVSANGDPARLAFAGLPVVADAGGGADGPLGGVLAGLRAAAARGATHVVTVPVDSPFPPRDLAARLRKAAAEADAQVAVAATARADGSPLRQPVFALWSVSLSEVLAEAFARGVRKVGAFQNAQGAATAVWARDCADCFFNVNAPSDLCEAERLAAGEP